MLNFNRSITMNLHFWDSTIKAFDPKENNFQYFYLTMIFFKIKLSFYLCACFILFENFQFAIYSLGLIYIELSWNFTSMSLHPSTPYTGLFKTRTRKRRRFLSSVWNMMTDKISAARFSDVTHCSK